MDAAQAMRTLQKKRTTNFREDETKLLIQLWGSPQIQNKLYLTHRKAPVMRLLAANMQQRGFYRTPDEIKTRIRNLKCLYHRIKRTVQSGTGVGTVDPDWPHFKAMDDILSRQGHKKDSLYKDNVFDECKLEGPRCEDIKQEIDDIDINDDMDSFTTNSLHGSEYEEDSAQNMPPLTPAPKKEPKKELQLPPPEKTPKGIPNILPKVTIPIQNVNPNGVRSASTPSIPFPLLILNGVPQQTLQGGEKKDGVHPTVLPRPQTMHLGIPDSSAVFKEILEVQKEKLEVEKQRLELDKQKLEFERLVGSQLLTLLPMFGGLLQRVAFNEGSGSSSKNGKKRMTPEGGFDILKDSKILRNVLEQGIKKYMLGEDKSDENDSESEGGGEEESEKQKG